MLSNLSWDVNFIGLSDWLCNTIPPHSTRITSYYIAGSISGQYEAESCVLISYPFCEIFLLYCKFFTDHACYVEMAGYWSSSRFALLWTSTSPQSIKTHRNKELGNI